MKKVINKFLNFYKRNNDLPKSDENKKNENNF